MSSSLEAARRRNEARDYSWNPVGTDEPRADGRTVVDGDCAACWILPCRGGGGGVGAVGALADNERVGGGVHEPRRLLWSAAGRVSAFGQVDSSAAPVVDGVRLFALGWTVGNCL